MIILSEFKECEAGWAGQDRNRIANFLNPQYLRRRNKAYFSRIIQELLFDLAFNTKENIASVNFSCKISLKKI